MADVQFMMQKDLGDMTSLSSNIKGLRANIDQQVKTYGKYAGIDANALQQVALTSAFYKIDPKTGQKVLKETSELDPNEDYIQAAIRDNPDLVAKGDAGLRNQLKAFQPKSTGDAVTREVKGVTTEHKYTAKLPPYMELVKDANGIASGVKVRSEKIGGVDVADQDTYQAFITDPASAVALNSMFKNWNQTQRTKLDPGSEEADVVRRKLLFDYLGKNGVYEFKPESKVTNNSLRDKMDLGVPLQSYRAGLSDAAKLLKENKKLDGLDTTVALRGLGGDTSVLEGAETHDAGGRQFYDITERLGGMKLGYDADHKSIYATRISVDPISKTLKVEAPGKEPAEYKGAAIRKFFKENSTFNGLTLDKIDKSLNLYTNTKGDWTGPQDANGIAQLQAQQDIQRLNAKKEVKAKVDGFATSGDVNDLSSLKNRDVAGGGKITSIAARGGFKTGLGMDPFYVEVKTGNRTEKKTFATAYLLAEYLKKNIQ